MKITKTLLTIISSVVLCVGCSQGQQNADGNNANVPVVETDNQSTSVAGTNTESVPETGSNENVAPVAINEEVTEITEDPDIDEDSADTVGKYEREYYIGLVSNLNVDDATQARLLMVNRFYDEALTLYEKDVTQLDAASMINLGYLYANGLTYKGFDISKAGDYYAQANCMESTYNFLYMLLVQGIDIGIDALKDGVANDDVVMEEYLKKCLPYIDSFAEGNAYDGDGKIVSWDQIVNDLYDWSYVDQWYRGFNPPSDTNVTRWIFQGSGLQDAANYRKQVRNLSIGCHILEKIYYMDGDGLVELEQY